MVVAQSEEVGRRGGGRGGGRGGRAVGSVVAVLLGHWHRVGVIVGCGTRSSA